MKPTVATVLAISLAAQTSPTRLAFEVASIKPSRATGGFSANHNQGGLTATNASLRNLIKMAYALRNYQLGGAPGWLDADRFDIVARAPAGAAASQINAMLQSLLAERFKLTLHRETKAVQGYSLVAARSGPKLTASASGTRNFNSSRGSILAQMLTVPQLADALSYRLDCPIVDRSGIPGAFDLKLEWSDDEGPTIFTALQEQLGLKLEAARVPAEMMVIDHVDRQPAEN
jgi:uncharacterized protein (TIGR03435 family)